MPCCCVGRIVGLLNFVVGQVYPAARTIEFVRGKTREPVADGSQWAVYWSLFFLLVSLEGLMAPVIDCLPGYNLLRILLLTWLVHADYLGASFIWTTYLEKPFELADDKLRVYYADLLALFMKARGITPIDEDQKAKCREVDKLWQAYREVVFTGPAVPEYNAFAIVTAWNPRSRLVSQQDNDTAQANLEARLRQQGVEFSPITGGSRNGDWQEYGIAVDMSLNASIALARELDQNAIYYVVDGVVSCVPVLLEGLEETVVGALTARTSGMWTGDKVRREFIDYFAKNHAHTEIPSAPVVPFDDPTLLFVNAGMNQFKGIFTGQIEKSHPFASLKRAVDTQKCIRAGGKHNDLEDVGKDGYHHTMFEMLGNWSFGDFFKREAITWAWDLLTRVYGIDKDRLYVTYFGGDEQYPDVPVDTEARDIWLEFLPADRIIPCDAKDNFWEMGDTGPCGPCSEIHFDRIGSRFVPELVNADDPMVLEVWNLVFMQYNKDHSGKLARLPAPCVDTGMGLERITSVLQNVFTNYDTDLFTALFASISEACPGAPHPYTGKFGSDDDGLVDTSFRVIADHIRTLTVSIADGAVPSNEGRGYVIRRILRRAVRFGRQYLNAPSDSPWLSQIVDGVVATLGSAFPELGPAAPAVKRIIADEEKAFARTLDRGVALFNRAVSKVKAAGQGTLSGSKAFELYASYGFPLDLTVLMAEEANLIVDTDGFAACFEQHQRVSDSGKFKSTAGLDLSAEKIDHLAKALAVPPTDDSRKYDWTPGTASGCTVTSTIRAVWDGKEWLDAVPVGKTVGVFLAETNFYSESGGQVGDVGTIVAGNVDFDVEDTKRYGSFVMHLGQTDSEGLKVGSAVEATPHYGSRLRLAQNHSGTHLLNFALRKVLGAECDQKGSLVLQDRLRFDYSTEKVLTVDEIAKVEAIVREQTATKASIKAELMPLKEANELPGVRALFGEHYPDPVRVVSMGTDSSVEFCGGTHLHNTAELDEFVVLSDEAVSRGVRRIVAATGQDAKDILAGSAAFVKVVEESRGLTGKALESGLNDLKALLKAKRSVLSLAAYRLAQNVVDELQVKKTEEGKAQSKERKRLAESAGKEIATKAVEGGSKFVVTCQPELASDFKAIEALTNEFTKTAAVPLLVISKNDKQASVLAVSAREELSANDWVTSVLKSLGGKGGGKKTQARGTCEASHFDEMQSLAEDFARLSL